MKRNTLNWVNLISHSDKIQCRSELSKLLLKYHILFQTTKDGHIMHKQGNCSCAKTYYFYLGHSLLVGYSWNYSIKVLLNCIIRYLLTLQSLIPNRKLGASVHLIEQWCYDVDLFAPKSDFCVICLILIYILQYYMMTLNVILLYINSENETDSNMSNHVM